MPDWHDRERPFPLELFGRIEPKELLYEYDWPITFTFECELGLFLAHLVSVDGAVRHHVVVPIKESDVEKLKVGTITVRAVFDHPLLWIIGCGLDWEAVDAHTISGLDDLGPTALPAEGVMLYPDLEPLLRVRLLGVRDSDGMIGADLMRSLVARVQKAVRDLTDIAKKAMLDTVHTFGPIEELIALRTQQVAFKSLEIAFREPDRNFMESRASSDQELATAYSVFAEMKVLLNQGLAWTATTSPSPAILTDTETQRRLLGAIKQLSPHGGEDEVELSGRLVHREASRPVRLLRKDTRKLSYELDRLRKSSTLTVTVSGIVDEFDFGYLSFTLRSTDEGEEYRFRYTSALRASVLTAFHSRSRVIVVGTKKPGDRTLELVKIA